MQTSQNVNQSIGSIRDNLTGSSALSGIDVNYSRSTNNNSEDQIEEGKNESNSNSESNNRYQVLSPVQETSDNTSSLDDRSSHSTDNSRSLKKKK